MIFVIETVKGEVTKVATFARVSGFNALEAADEYAKQLCDKNGILFQGRISCDGSVNNYSVQILEQ